MNIERQQQLLGILRNRYAMFSKDDKPMNVSVYADYYWDEITDLAKLHPEYVHYSPPNPKGHPMYETGKHEVLPAIMNLPQNIGKTPQSEQAEETQQAANDVAGQEAYMNDAQLEASGKRALAYLRGKKLDFSVDDTEEKVKEDSFLSISSALWKAGWEYFDVARNWKSPNGVYFHASNTKSAYAYELQRRRIVQLEKENAELETENHELNLALQSEKVIRESLERERDIADKQIEALKAESARYQTRLKRLVATMDKALEYTVNWDKLSDIRNQANDILVVVEGVKPEPVQDAPEVTQKLFYGVKEHVDTVYKTDEYSGKRYPSDYSVFIVIAPNGKVVDSFSALTHGLEDAEYLANELRDKLNKGL